MYCYVIMYEGKPVEVHTDSNYAIFRLRTLNESREQNPFSSWKIPLIQTEENNLYTEEKISQLRKNEKKINNDRTTKGK